MKILLTIILSLAILLPISAFAGSVTQYNTHTFVQDCYPYQSTIFTGKISAINEDTPDLMSSEKSIKIDYPGELSHCWANHIVSPQFLIFKATATQGSEACYVTIYINDGTYYCDNINAQSLTPIKVYGTVTYEFLGPFLPQLVFPFNMTLHF